MLRSANHRQRHRSQGNREVCVVKVAPYLPECPRSAPMPGGPPAQGTSQAVCLVDTNVDHTVSSSGPRLLTVFADQVHKLRSGHVPAGSGEAIAHLHEAVLPTTADNAHHGYSDELSIGELHSG